MPHWVTDSGKYKKLGIFNLEAILFTLAVFLYWWVVGFATISLFAKRLRVIQGLLLSPAIGIAVTIILVFYINRAGIPVKDFGKILLPALATIALCIIVVKRPIIPVKKSLPFITIIVAALFLVAWPMLMYGFYWLSFCNDDMANYCLGAQRFLNNGYYTKPNIDVLQNGKDYSQFFYFFHVSSNVRPGSELMLAAVWACTGLNAHLIYMPVIIALHLSLLTVTGAMLTGISTSSRKRIPLIGMGLMAMSPLTTLGAIYQLIGQVGGLTLAVAAITLMYRPMKSLRPLRIISESLPAAAVLAAIFIWYPEVLPFLGLGWLVYFVLNLKRCSREAITVLYSAIYVLLIASIVINRFGVTALCFLVNQMLSGLSVQTYYGPLSADPFILFPYYLVPSGMAVLWGLIPFNVVVQEPYLSMAIAGALVLFYWTFKSILPRQIRLATAPISILLVMFLMGLVLFFRTNDFGLFKLAMFMQPFLVGVVSIELANFNLKSSWTFKSILLVVIALLINSQSSSVIKSKGAIGSGSTEIPAPSSNCINKQFEETINQLPELKKSDTVLLLRSSNVVLAKFNALYTQGIKSFFVSQDFLTIFKGGAKSEEDIRIAMEVEQYLNASIEDNQFFQFNRTLYNENLTIDILPSPWNDLFNGFNRVKGDNYFEIYRHPINLLAFIPSKLGLNYYGGGDRKIISMYQLEPDLMMPKAYISSLGRHMLLEAVNPTIKPRLVMELSATLLPQHERELPKPLVQGAPLQFVGRGSGRVISDQIYPSLVSGGSFISIDMDRDGKPFPSSPKGLMLLYGRGILLDSRVITILGRDISLISEEQYVALQPPSNVARFPEDLAIRSLEYSGIYEDGWISEQSFFVLTAKQEDRYFKIAGSVPMIKDSHFTTLVTLRINSEDVARQQIDVGHFELKAEVMLQGKQRIDIIFSKHQRLPGADGRIVGAKVDFLGFTSSEDVK